MSCRMSALANLVALTALLAASGCTRKGGEDTSALQTEGPRPAPGAVAEPAAESSLSIKKGVVSAAGDHALFRFCDDKTELWLIDVADGSLTELLTEATATLYVEAYGERGPVPEDLAAAREQAGVFILEQLLYAGTAAEGRGCEQPAPDYVVAARGNEPFWAVEVTHSGMVWKQAETPQQIALGELQAEDAEGTVRYRASGSGHLLELMIDAQPCRDSMSDEFFAFAARAVLDGKEFKGCARVGQQDAR